MMTTEPKETMRDLFKQFGSAFAQDDVKKRDGYKDKNGDMHEFDYIEWWRFVQVLNEIAPDWTSSIKGIQFSEYADIKKDDQGKVVSSTVKKLCLTTVSLTINGITRDGVGVGETDEKGIKKSEHDGIKRAAIKFNLGLRLYFEGKKKGGSSDQGSKPKWATSKDKTWVCTDGQYAAMESRAGKLGIDMDRFAQDLWPESPGLTAGKLSKKAASYVIESLDAQIALLETVPAASQPAANVGAPTLVEVSTAPDNSTGATIQQVNAIKSLSSQLKGVGMTDAGVFNEFVGKYGSSSPESMSEFTAAKVIKDMSKKLFNLRRSARGEAI